jgi:hypothetical protein
MRIGKRDGKLIVMILNSQDKEQGSELLINKLKDKDKNEKQQPLRQKSPKGLRNKQ